MHIRTMLRALLLIGVCSVQVLSGQNLLNNNPRLREEYRGEFAKWPSVGVDAVDPKGRPSVISGDIGKVSVTNGSPDDSELRRLVSAYLRPFKLQFPDVKHVATTTDDLGYTHVRYVQVIRGEVVTGSDLLVHIAPSGDVNSITSHLTDEHAAKSFAKHVTKERAELVAKGTRRGIVVRGAKKDPIYRLHTETGAINLTYAVNVVNESPFDPPLDEEVFVDVETGEVVDVESNVFHIARELWTFNGTTTLNTTPVRLEGWGPVGDSEANAIFDNLGHSNAFFVQEFGWPSYWANSGVRMIATFNFSNWANAAYYRNERQFKFGAGQGSTYRRWGLSLDVNAHEFGHGFVHESCGLAYSGEGGALHEALADFFGVATEAKHSGWSNDHGTVWTMGEALAADGSQTIRKLYNPTIWNSYKDNYADRTGDFHRDSTIISLALKLLVTGGQHPRSSTLGRDATIPALGWAKMKWIVYDCVRNRMSTNDSFQDFRFKLRDAARARYGIGTGTAVDIAMDLTGVPNGGNNLRPVNMSSRGPVDGGNPLILGFVLSQGGSAKNLLIRTAGPALYNLGVGNPCWDPRMSLHQVGVGQIGYNDNWDYSLASISNSVGAFPFASGSADAALLPNLSGGLYTAVMEGASGEILGELYDTDTNNPTQVINLSSRGLVRSNAPMHAGFIIRGSGTKRLLIRAVGPNLTQYGVTNALSNPRVDIYAEGLGPVYQNDNWSSQPNATTVQSVSQQIGAAALPWGSADAAVIVDLPEGNYTAVASGGDGTALVEVFVIQ